MARACILARHNNAMMELVLELRFVDHGEF